MSSILDKPLPPIVPYPSHSLREHIPVESWQACLDAWILLARAYLSLPTERFSDNLSPSSSLTEFLVSYVIENDRDLHSSRKTTNDKSKDVHDAVFLLLHRALLEARDAPKDLLSVNFLAAIARVYGCHATTSNLLRKAWDKHLSVLEKWTQAMKIALISASEDPSSPTWQEIPRLVYLVKMLPPVGELLMTGTDLLDSFVDAHGSIDPALATHVLALLYLSLTGLLQLQRPNISLLVEQLYSLQSSAETKKSGTSEPLTIALVSDTPLLPKLKRTLTGSDATRAEKVLASLSKITRPSKAPPSKHPRKPDKGKARDTFGHNAFATQIHPHRFSLITTIQDVFPDLGSAFILHLLDHHGDNQETIIAALLEDSLPPSLASLDRSKQLPPTAALASESSHHDDLIPREPSPPVAPIISTLPERRNKYDNDAFDRLAISPSQLHRGKSSRAPTDPLTNTNSSAAKAAIYSALASFDPDDDERDDTYDVEDVGGTVDSARPGDDAGISDLREKNEEALFRVWTSGPGLFERSARLGQGRNALKSETGMSDEQIEGWASMLRRDPRRLKALEAKFTSFGGFGGQQNVVESTRWQASGDEDSGAEGASRGGRGGLRGRGGQGRGRGRGRGNVAGATNERSTQIARERKEQNKGSSGNHNRRDQRAKKMAKGGFPG